ncbi:hypothetical protein E2C01_019011 [Portunus trituberculatus]|uniref:Uncharacterized protein n=1 Tax=Portunus trituberculatus TaxID=210409 RepID=A0A5B7DXW6_PORTR|nr:hypothetical protein [Portunus trituberculatus]
MIILLLLLLLLFCKLGPKVAKGETSGEGSNQDGPLAKKHASDKKISADRKKLLKDKKRTLKRL